MERDIIRQSIKRGIPLPDKMQNAPRLRPGLELFWEGFTKLTTCRAPGAMGPPGRIPWTAIDQYCARRGYEGYLREDFEAIILQIDEAYLDYVIEEHKKETS